jgi:hypothetical protein
MEVVALTLFLSLLLAVLFVVFFIRDRRNQQRHLGSAEQDALLPFQDEQASSDEHGRVGNLK